MFAALQVLISRFVTLITVFVLSFGGVADSLALDTTAAYKLNYDKVDIFLNDMDTSVPQKVVYDIISDHFNAPLKEGTTEKKCIFIGYDGCRVDVLNYRSENGGINRVLANDGSALAAYAGGTRFPLPITQETSTRPGWCSMITGLYGLESGVVTNADQPLDLSHPTLLRSLISDGLADSTAFYCSWGGHFDGDTGTYSLEKAYAEQNGIPAVFIRFSDDDGTVGKAIEDLQQPDCTDFIFLTIEQTDHEGHTNGFSAFRQGYRDALMNAENYCDRILDALEARETYETEDWLVIMSTDHGGINTGHGGVSIQERYTWIVANEDLSGYLPAA